MLRFQGDLERLPVPGLAETCALYLELVHPLLTATEFAATRRAVDELFTSGGVGDTLQRRLLDWSRGHENWLEPFWDDWYLCDDAPLPIHVSPGFVLHDTGRGQAARAARLLAGAVSFKRLVDREELEPDLRDGKPRCMREYSRVLASTRIPGVDKDALTSFPGSRHVVVARRGQLFSLDVLDAERRPYAVEYLERALQTILDHAQPPAAPIGVLTSDTRRAWAAVREAQLLRGPRATRDALAAVESAILVLALDDDTSPSGASSAAAARSVLHGDVRNRWFDKSIQLVVAGNGVAGFCMEHAGFDGSTALHFARFLAEHEDARGDDAARDRDLAPRALDVEPTAPLLAEIARTERAADALVRQTGVVVLDIEDLGKRSLARHDLSPDGFVQMAFQLAYFRLAGELASTYESVDTKRFLHGRTEAMRCVSDESSAFVRSPSEERLRAAVARHRAVVSRCREGRGVDRHLLGLRRMLEADEPLPELFTDPAYGRLTRSVLSTSSTRSTPGVELACFGPVVDEGFGLSYTIHDDAIRCVVTNFHGLAGGFAEALERGIRDMESLLG